jgi:hypothetical protein
MKTDCDRNHTSRFENISIEYADGVKLDMPDDNGLRNKIQACNTVMINQRSQPPGNLKRRLCSQSVKRDSLCV